VKLRIMRYLYTSSNLQLHHSHASQWARWITADAYSSAYWIALALWLEYISATRNIQVFFGISRCAFRKNRRACTYSECAYSEHLRCSAYLAHINNNSRYIYCRIWNIKAHFEYGPEITLFPKIKNQLE